MTKDIIKQTIKYQISPITKYDWFKFLVFIKMIPNKLNFTWFYYSYKYQLLSVFIMKLILREWVEASDF